MTQSNKINENDKKTYYSLDKLLLDETNPRFGDLESTTASQTVVLDHIVEKFGVADVISSLAVNGYFDAEPLVCRRKSESDKLVVAEGNRRLAACLILAGDPRAAGHAKLAEQYRPIWEKHGKKQIDPLPVILFDSDSEEKELLSYLGVRHIASSQAWDSYAKAAWVAKVVELSKLPLNDVALMIGDQHKTIPRMLEGYYFIQQLIKSGQFYPEDSVRKGRGSVTEYPFSWVYTMLGYSATRGFLELEEKEPVKSPVAEKNLPKAGLLVKVMFGDKSKGKSSAVSDSRELKDLATAFQSPEKITMLEQGKTVKEIVRLTKPIEDRLRGGLFEIKQIQDEILSGLTENQVKPKTAAALVDQASKNKRSSNEIEKKLIEASAGEEK